MVYSHYANATKSCVHFSRFAGECRCSFVFEFLSFFIVFRCHISFIKENYFDFTRLRLLTNFLFILCFYLTSSNQQKTQFCPNVRYHLVAFTGQNVYHKFSLSGKNKILPW